MEQPPSAEVFLPVPRNGDVPAVELDAVRFGLRAVLQMGANFNLRRDINDVLNLAGRVLVWPAEPLARLQRFLTGRCAEHSSWKGVGDLDPAAFLARHGVWNGIVDDTTIYYYLDEFVKQNGKELVAVLATTVEHLDRELADRRVLLVENLSTLRRLLGLNEAETAVLHCAGLVRIQRELRTVLIDCKVKAAEEACRLLGELLRVPPNAVAGALRAGGRLETLSLIDQSVQDFNVTDVSDMLKMSDRLLAVLIRAYESEQELLSMFARPSTETALTAEDYPHVADDVKALVALLTAATRQHEPGVNVLIYGPPGTGKSEMARVLAKAASCQLFEVDYRDQTGAAIAGKDRYRSLQMAQAFLKDRRDTLIVFDEIEDVFPTVNAELAGLLSGEDHKHASVSGKAWVNQTLETNPIPTLWISNAINQIDPAYLRRFQYHLELQAPPAHVRETIARKQLDGLNVSSEFVSELAKRPTLTPAQIRSAARFARLTQGTLGDSAEDLVLRQIDRAAKVLGQEKRPEEGFRPLVTTYDLELLNIETRHPVEKIVQALARHKRGTLCFYGLPGTGKTALAEHIARAIERPLMIRRASDLVSKFVGETEQSIAKMFRDAETEGAMVLLDEADSFLQNRQLAHRNYEVSEVNEMLQGMERFNGVFVCTTNLFDRIDEAALRRFTFKIRFLPLKPEQRERMFVTEALAGNAEAMTDPIRLRLQAMNLLTPGDFAAVRRQAALFDEAIEVEDFLGQLERELAVKPEIREARSIGFTSTKH